MAQDRSPLMSYILLPSLCTAVGVAFGYALENGKMADPQVIKHQMVGGDYAYTKFFLSAMAMGMVAMSLLASLSFTQNSFSKVCTGYYSKLAGKGMLSSAVGGFLLGGGMILAGSCPITVFCQIGAKVPNALITYVGGLAGTLMYGIFQSSLDSTLKPSQSKTNNPWLTSSFQQNALPVAAVLAAAVYFLPGALLGPRSPVVAGAILGMLHVPLLLSIGEALGGSSSFLVVLAQIPPLRPSAPILGKFQWGFKRWWQIFYVGGIVAGGYLSASFAGRLGSASGVGTLHAFLGGLLTCFGSRIAAGCTSGHGFSGTSFLHPISFVLVVAMFAGAYVTDFLM